MNPKKACPDCGEGAFTAQRAFQVEAL